MLRAPHKSCTRRRGAAPGAVARLVLFPNGFVADRERSRPRKQKVASARCHRLEKQRARQVTARCHLSSRQQFEHGAMGSADSRSSRAPVECGGFAPRARRHALKTSGRTGAHLNILAVAPYLNTCGLGSGCSFSVRAVAGRAGSMSRGCGLELLEGHPRGHIRLVSHVSVWRRFRALRTHACAVLTGTNSLAGPRAAAPRGRERVGNSHRQGCWFQPDQLSMGASAAGFHPGIQE